MKIRYLFIAYSALNYPLVGHGAIQSKSLLVVKRTNDETYYTSIYKSKYKRNNLSKTWRGYS